MRKRLFALLVFVSAVAGFLSAAQPTQARSIPPLYGCDSLINWPCPGPVLVNP